MRVAFTIFILCGYQLICFGGPLYRYPATDGETILRLSEYGGEPVCGSTPDSLLIEFRDSTSAIHAARRFPQLRKAASNPIDLYGSGPAIFSDEVNEYRTFPLIQSELTNYAQLYPNLVRIDTIGTSIQHRPLLRLRISDSVNTHRDIPPILILGGTHGNEVIGVEVVMEYLSWLFAHVVTDTSIQRRLSQVELHVIPVFNPDGFVNGNRHNANNVDLNRNFRYHWGYAAVNYGTAPLSEPETFALDSLLRIVQPTTSISYHSYGEMVLRPYSWTAREAPDSLVTRTIASRYHAAVSRYQNILGGQLYYHGGEHNDHNISTLGTDGITVEVWRGPYYNPPADSIVSVCTPHRAGIDAVIDRAVKGQLTGVIRDSITGEPIVNATWQITSQWDTDYLPRPVGSETGRYRILREPGTLTMQITAPDYQSRTVQLQVVDTNTPTVQDISLLTNLSAIRGTFTIFGSDSSDTIFAQCQQSRIAFDSSVTFWLTRLQPGLDTMIVQGDSFETIHRPVLLMPSDTLGVIGFTVKRIPPVVDTRQIIGNDLLFSWYPPYSNPTAASLVRGYSIERNGEEYIPLTFDTSFSEQFLPGSPDVTYRIRAVYASNEYSSYSDTIFFSRSSDVSETELPLGPGIGKPYPNPFNDRISIPYRLAPSQTLELTLYDITGRELVHTFVTGHTRGVWQWSPQGIHNASGIYFLVWKLETIHGRVKFIYLR